MSTLEAPQVEILPPLSLTEKADLSIRERIIETAQKMVKEAWHALKEIHDLGLYREYGNWGQYLQTRWKMSPQHAGRLLQAAAMDLILIGAGLAVPNERRIRPLTPILNLPEDLQQATADVVKNVFGSKPTPAQINAFGESLKVLVNTGHIPHPETGEPTPWTSIPEQIRGEVFRAAVTQEAYTTLQRQKGHIKESIRSRKQAGQVQWGDLPTDHVKQNLRHELIFTVKSVNGDVSVIAHCKVEGQILYSAENVTYLKGAVLALMRELGDLPEEEEAL